MLNKRDNPINYLWDLMNIIRNKATSNAPIPERVNMKVGLKLNQMIPAKLLASKVAML